MKLIRQTGRVALVAAALVMVADLALAQTPTYKTLSAGGNSSAGATVVFPSDPSTAVRLVSLTWESDSATAALQFSSGAGAYAIMATNAATTTVTNVVNTTQGLVANSVVILEHLGSTYVTTISSTNSGTNMVLAAGGWGVLPSVGDSVYQMSAATSVKVGASTNWQNGEALFVGNRGRPVRVVLTPAGTTNRLNAATARYD